MMKQLSINKSQLGYEIGNDIRQSQKFNLTGTPASPIYTFSLAGGVIAYMPSQCTNREKYLNHFNYKEENADPGGK